MPSTDFEDRIAALEERLAAPIVLRDLPLAQLQRKLETDWQPDPKVLLSARYIETTVYSANSGALASGAESANIVVNHGLGATPTAVLGGLQDGTWSHQFSWRWTATATQVTLKFLNHGPNNATAILKFVLVPA